MNACASTSRILVVLLLPSLLAGAVGCKSTPAPMKGSPPITQAGESRPSVDEELASDEAPLGEAPGSFVTTRAPVMMRRIDALEIVANLDVGDAPGYLLWSSTSGSLAVMAIFEDTDKDGAISPRFGQHGEPLGDQARYHLFATATGEHLATYDEVLVWDESKRFISFRQASRPDVVDIFDARRMEHISLDLASLGALTSSEDGNDCLAPRHVHITPQGSITLIAASERALVRTSFEAWRGDAAKKGSQLVEVLPTRASEGDTSRIWRVEGVGDGWLSVLFVDRDTDGDGVLTLPRQRTSCACRFCHRFAMSFGFYGWSGDEWSSKLMAPDGRLSKRSQDRLVPLSSEVALEVGGERYLSWPEQKVLKDEGLTKGCSHVPWLQGVTPGALMMCPGEVDERGAENRPRLMVWRPETSAAWTMIEGVEADAPAQRPVLSEATTYSWFASVHREAVTGMMDQKVSMIRRLARVRVEDLRVEFVDVPLAEGATLRWLEPAVAWSMAATDDVLLLDVASGQSFLLSATSQAMEEGEVVFSRGDEVWANVGMSSMPGRVVSGRLDEACVMTGGELEGSAELAKGPWRVQCVRAPDGEAQEQE